MAKGSSSTATDGVLCGRCNKPKDGEDSCCCGRPTKLTAEFLAAAESVLAQGDDVIIFTDDELRIAINEKLPEEQQVGKSTFEAWKSDAKEGREDDNFKKFQGLIEKAINREKRSLFKQLREDEKAWQRWAWIIERKFDEWNIKRKLGIGPLPKDGASALAAAMLETDEEVPSDDSVEGQ